MTDPHEQAPHEQSEQPTATPQPSASQEKAPKGGDPWHAFGYIVSGVMIYGALGWGLDRWLDTNGLVAVGILAGAALGIYMTWKRFNLVIENSIDSTANDSKERS